MKSDQVTVYCNGRPTKGCCNYHESKFASDKELTLIVRSTAAAGFEPPADRTLVVGWRAEYTIPRLLEYRAKRNAFYSGEMPVTVDHFIELRDLVGDDETNKIRRTWDRRDGRKVKTK